MRYEPANAKFFETEVRWKSLHAALRLLGCFNTNRTEFAPRVNIELVKRGSDDFETFFCTLDDAYFREGTRLSPVRPENENANVNSTESSPTQTSKLVTHFEMDDNLIYICFIMRYLYDTAIDSFDK